MNRLLKSLRRRTTAAGEPRRGWLPTASINTAVALLFLASLCTGQQIDLVTQTKGKLPVSKGGTNSSGPWIAARCVRISADGLSMESSPLPCGEGDWVLYDPASTPSDGQVLLWDSASGKYIPADPVVSGPDAPGAAPTKNPVQVSGFDGTNVRRLLTDAAGRLSVNIIGALPAGAATIGGVNLSQYTPVSGRLPVDGSGVTQPVSGVFWPATQPVSGTFWQTTQPISAASLPLPSGAAQDRTSSILPAAVRLTDGAAFYKPTTPSDTQPVSGTFWQATQPVSLASVPSHAVTNVGTFAVQVTSAPITAVTGTFWQATQPVSLASVPSHAVTNAGTFAVQVTSAPSTAVTGTFWQATQPISSADGSQVTLGAKADAASTATDTTPVSVVSILKELSLKAQSPASTPVTGSFWQSTQPVSGTFWQATQPVSIATMPSTPVTGTFWQATQPVSGTFWQATQPISGAISFSAPQHTICDSGCTPGGSFADSSAFSFGVDAISNTGFVVDDVATNVVAENSAGAARMSTNRVLFVDLKNTQANATPIKAEVVGTGTFATQSAITAASGAFSSGALASGSVASGAIASGAVASGAYAAGSISDGADVTQGAKTDAKSTATDGTSVSIMSVLKEISAMEQAPASRAVTNAGTFAVQSAATLNAETTKVIGTVRVQGNVGGVFDAATGAAPPANAILAGGIVGGATGGFMGGIPICDTYVAVNISSGTTTLAVTGVSGRHVRICSINLVTAAANNVDLISGTGATCGTGTAGITGGTTAASGWNFAANGGLTLGNGLGTVLKTIAAGDSVCIVTSAATQLSGGISYVIY